MEYKILQRPVPIRNYILTLLGQEIGLRQTLHLRKTTEPRNGNTFTRDSNPRSETTPKSKLSINISQSKSFIIA